MPSDETYQVWNGEGRSGASQTKKKEYRSAQLEQVNVSQRDEVMAVAIGALMYFVQLEALFSLGSSDIFKLVNIHINSL